MTNWIKVYKLGHDEAFSENPTGARYIEVLAVPKMPDLTRQDLPHVLPVSIGLNVYCRTVNGKTEHYTLDPALRTFFEERCHEFMDVSALLRVPAASKAIENIRAEDSRTILQLQGEKQELERQERRLWRKKQELERKLLLSRSLTDQLNGLFEGFEKAPVWRRLWIALFPSRFYA